MPKATIDFSRILTNKGRPIKDMIDAPEGMTEANAPDLTLGSLFYNALSIGIQASSMKETMKLMQLAQEIELAMKQGGKVTYDEGRLSQLEESIMKVRHPMFLTPLYGNQMILAIQTAKNQIVKEMQAEAIKNEQK